MNPEKKLIKFAVCKDLLKTDFRMRIKIGRQKNRYDWGFFTKKTIFFQSSGFVDSRLGVPSDEKVLKPIFPKKPTFTNGLHVKSAFPALQWTCSKFSRRSIL